MSSPSADWPKVRVVPTGNWLEFGYIDIAVSTNTHDVLAVGDEVAAEHNAYVTGPPQQINPATVIPGDTTGLTAYRFPIERNP